MDCMREDISVSKGNLAECEARVSSFDWLERGSEPSEGGASLNLSIYRHVLRKINFTINGKKVGCIKIGFKNVYISDYDKIIKLPNKMAFIYDTYVLEDQRKKGVAKYLITHAIKFLKAHKYTKVRCHIPPWNKASISAYEKIGFRKISYIRYFKIFGIPIRKVKPVK